MEEAAPSPLVPKGDEERAATIRILNTAFSDQGGLEVRRLADASKGLFALKCYEHDEVFWKEPPLLVMHSFSCPVAVCRHCLCSLQDHVSEGLECPGGCGHRYCSQDCVGKARKWYHMWVCSCRDGAPLRGNELRKFEDFARLTGNEYYVMAATGVAMAAASLMPSFGNDDVNMHDEDDLDELLSEQVSSWFGQFEQCPWWETLDNAAHTSSLLRESEDSARTGNYELSLADRRKVFEMDVEEQTREALALFVKTFPRRRAAQAQLEPPVSLFAWPNLSRQYACLLGAIRINSQLIRAPILSLENESWVFNREKNRQEGTKRRHAILFKTDQEITGKLEERTGDPNNCHSDVGSNDSNAGSEESGDDLDECSDDFVEGMGMFRIHSCINHSCNPNAHMTFSGAEHRGHAWVRSLRDIVEGEEIFISYVDPTLPLTSRQAKLREQYLFTCACTRCMQEITASSVITPIAPTSGVEN